MTDEYDERKWFFDRRTDKTIISKAFSNKLTGEKLRIASHIVEGQPGLKFAEVNDEVVLRQTPAGRYEINCPKFVRPKALTFWVCFYPLLQSGSVSLDRDA